MKKLLLLLLFVPSVALADGWQVAPLANTPRSAPTPGVVMDRANIDKWGQQVVVLGDASQGGQTGSNTVNVVATPGAAGFLKSEDAASASGDAGEHPLAVFRSAPSQSAGTAGDYSDVINDNQGAVWSRLSVPDALGAQGADVDYISAASTNSTSVANAPRSPWVIFAANTTAAYKYVKLYNTTSAPTCGSGTPVLRLPVPPNNTVVYQDPYGSAAFGTGIGMCITGGAADSDTTATAANDVFVHMHWR